LRFFVDDIPIVQDILRHFFFVPAHEFSIGPNGVLRTINLVHDVGHQKKDKGVNNSIDLSSNLAIKEDGIDVGSKNHGE
jgi:hypothetical protein